MAEQRTDVAQDGESLIVRKLDGIERKLTFILWLLALPLILTVLWVMLTLVAFVFSAP